MNSLEQVVDVLVIGAGLAGLMAATELQRAGRTVLVLDKGRAVGGRMSNRRIGGATFDHGAQFITARSPRFVAQLQAWEEAGAVQEWCRGFTGSTDGHVRWRGRPSMTAIGKLLAPGLTVSLEKQIARLSCEGGLVVAETNTKEIFTARAVVLTAPVPQALVLLDAGGVVLAPEMRARLEAIQYERCFAVMAVLEGPSRIPAPGGFTPEGGPIAWIADNQLKGVSAEPAVTIHATNEFSVEHWEQDRQETARALLDAAEPWLGSAVQTFQIHGWRYSKPMQVDAELCALVSQSPPLVLAGDAFAGPRVEGAALSGWAAAEALLARASG